MKHILTDEFFITAIFIVFLVVFFGSLIWAAYAGMPSEDKGVYIFKVLFLNPFSIVAIIMCMAKACGVDFF